MVSPCTRWRWAARVSSAVGIIMITANEGKRHEDYARELGVDDYIRKPFPMDRLLDSVDRLLAARRS